MSIVELSTGVSLNYQSSGAGEPVLLIMGTGADHTLWEPTVGALGDAYQVITYDNRGTGQSSCPPDAESYSMAILAADAVALLDELEIERARPYSSHMAFTEMAEEFNVLCRAFLDEHATS